MPNMWKSFEIDEIHYILKAKCEDNILKVIISDLKSIWSEEISSTDTLCRFKEINPSFLCRESIIQSVFWMIDNIEKALEKNILREDDSLILNISKLEKEYMIEFKFVLNKLQQHEFFSLVTLPMVQTVLHLEQSVGVLHDFIQRKDRELEEYRLEKGEISREDLKTKPYDFNATGKCLNQELMLNLFDKKFLPEISFGNHQADSEKSVIDGLKKKSLKRKIYSAKNSNKKQSWETLK